MTLEQAIEVLKDRYNSGVTRRRTDDEWRLATDTVIVALRGPQPDPITGLVPCGCGGPVQLLEDNYCSYWVECAGCGIKLGYWESMDDGEPNGSFGKKQDAVKVWNTAMGWKGGAE